jgi:L-alanine-DL-glutamate epimerase-like enolase superfamily enzyme
MERRSFLKSTGLGAASLAAPLLPAAEKPTPPMKITRVRFYHNPKSMAVFNLSFHVVTIETDQGITGIGEGGSKDTIEQCAAMIIGEDPARIEYLWQMMFRGYFYPAGREKLHALGALDLALWDIKGKALGVPVYELLGGLTRDYIECYSGDGIPPNGSVKETARACMEEGFRVYRIHAADRPPGQPFDPHHAVDRAYQQCVEIREGVGKEGDWAIDYHTRFALPQAIRLSTLIEPLAPFFCEDPLRSENIGVYRELRPLVKVPIAMGEQLGSRWDIRELVEGNLIDYSRISLPNAGGITEFMKLAALCETHYVGLIPHFTGPISEAALVHACGVFPGPVLMEMTRDGARHGDPHLPESYEFRQGKMWPNRRPGLGVTLDTKPLQLVAEITERSRPIPLAHCPDGSIINA